MQHKRVPKVSCNPQKLVILPACRYFNLTGYYLINPFDDFRHSDRRKVNTGICVSQRYKSVANLSWKSLSDFCLHFHIMCVKYCHWNSTRLDPASFFLSLRCFNWNGFQSMKTCFSSIIVSECLNIVRMSDVSIDGGKSILKSFPQRDG